MRMRTALLAVICFLSATPLANAKSQSLRIALTGRYPPFSYYDNQGNLTGFDVEMAYSICAEMKQHCEIKILQWDAILGALLAGQIDLIIASMAITPERQAQANFSVPYYESGAQLFVRDLEVSPETPQYRVGVVLGTTYDAYVRKRYPTAKLRTYKSDTEILQDIISGRLDAMVTDRLVGSHLNKKFNAKLKTSGPPLYVEQIGIPVVKENILLLSRVNKAIKVIRSSPLYDNLMTKYFGLKVSTTNDSILSKSLAIGLLLKGAWATIRVSATGLGIGFLMAMLLTVATLMLSKTFAALIAIWVDFIRSTPFMVQLFALYFGTPALGISISAWSAGVIAIAFHSSAYLAEIFKSAYQSIPRSQHNAARVLGLRRFESFRRVVLPQMMPILTVPTLNTTVAMIKDSAIVSVVGVYELTLQAQQLISTTFKPMQFYMLAALLYFLITYPLLLIGRRAERRFRKRGLLHGPT